METKSNLRESIFSADNIKGVSQNHSIQDLQDMANILRVHSVEMTTVAGTGHPSSCASMAEIASVIFFDQSGMHYNPKDPRDFASDRFVLSKGHGAPILYAAWAEVGYLDKNDLKTLRKLDSHLSGHPGTVLPFVDAAGGSLGQGLSVAMGMGYSSKYIDNINNKYFVVLGDGEIAEGQIWEACSFGAFYKLDNVIAVVDVNSMGQSGLSMFGHDVENYRRKFEAFGCHAITIDGHNIEEIILAFEWARKATNAPVVIIAKTFKGKGLTDNVENKSWHGKVMGEHHEPSLTYIRSLIKNQNLKLQPTLPKFEAKAPEQKNFDVNNLKYTINQGVATRSAYGSGLKNLGDQDTSNRIISLDGDTNTSTMACVLAKAYPKKFLECYVAEQNMICVAQGLAARGKIPFCSTFGAFMSRAFDQIRVVGISESNVKFCGSHAGVSIGPDGATQMALEDLALFRSIPKCVVLYPSDAVSTENAVALAANYRGPTYIRTSRPVTNVVYASNEKFEIGKAKIVRQSDKDVITVVTSGVTLVEAIGANEKLAAEGISIRVVDLFSVKPVDAETLEKCGKETQGRLLTVEEHYGEGGVHDAVSSALSTSKLQIYKICVDSVPSSGTTEELLDRYQLSASRIASFVKSVL